MKSFDVKNQISLKLNYFLDKDTFKVNKFGRLKFALSDTAMRKLIINKNYISIKYLHRIYVR